MATFKMQRARGDFGHVPSKVLEALVLDSSKDIGNAYRLLDYCYQLAPIGDGLGERRLRNWLTVEGLTPAEVQTVVDHVCMPRGHVAIDAPHAPKRNPKKRRPPVVKPVAHPAWSVMRSVYRPKKAKKRNPEQGPVNILATYSAADVGKHPVLDAALEIATLAKSIPVPYVRTSVSQIGGPHRASTIVTVGFDPRETWTNGIFENSRYARFDVSPGPQFSPYAGKSTTEPTIELISGHGVPKFRKARFKTPAEAIAKIAKWASEAGGAKRNPKGGFRGNLFGADLALAKSIAKHTGALTWEYIDARPALAARVKEARALGLTGLAAANFVFPAKGLPRQNPVPRASKAGPSGPRYGSGPERYYISDATAQSHARHIAPMTDENDHAGARLYLARTVLASPAFTEKVKDGNARMDRSHTSAHYHDNEAAWKANHALLKRMLAQVKRRTTPAGYAAIHGAF